MAAVNNKFGGKVYSRSQITFLGTSSTQKNIDKDLCMLFMDKQ